FVAIVPAPCALPREISAIFPVTVAGKSVALAPKPQKTVAPLSAGGGQSVSPAELLIAGSVAAKVRPSSARRRGLMKVERLSTPGATTFRPEPRCEKVATVLLASIAPTDSTVA